MKDVPGTSTTERPENAPPLSHEEKVVETGKVPFDAIKVLADSIGNGLHIAKQITKSNTSEVATALQNASDVTKCVSIVSGTFQCMAVGVQVDVLIGESRRGAKQYPLILCFIVQLY